MAENAPPGSPKPDAPKSDWARVAVWAVIALFLTTNVFIFLKSCREMPGQVIDKAGQLLEKGGKALADVASAFHQGRITIEFVSYASSIHPTHHLQFATLKQREIFTRKDEASTAFGYVPLPEVIVEARAPVEFTYYLDLNARWQIVLQDGVVQVLAPGNGRAPARNASRVWLTVNVGRTACNNAAAAVTCGAAMEVPLLLHAPVVAPPVERMATPGAVMAIPLPTLLKLASAPDTSLAATATAPRQLAGAELDTSAPLPLPAATTGSTPRAMRMSNAS